MPTNPIFEQLIGSYLKDSIGIVEHFISEIQSNNLIQELNTHLAIADFKHAGMGNLQEVNNDKNYRSDLIYWLDRKHDNLVENTFFDLIDELVLFLNQTCYTGITDYEFHFAHFAKGTSYKRHLDSFKNNNSRMYSMILYLNQDWKKEDGGELCVHHLNEIQLISPENRKCVFFKSNDILHEVLLSNKPRMSIAGWFKTAH